MHYYDKKYGVDPNNNEVQALHTARRMFAIKDNVLHIAPKDINGSHAQWFEHEGWICENNDDLMQTLVRGFVDKSGLYFYRGYDFTTDADAERIVRTQLKAIVEALGLERTLHVYGGLIKQDTLGKWPPRKDIGTIASLLEP